MNSVKLMLAGLLLGTFALSVTGCPGKKEEAPAVMESDDSAAPEMVDETVETEEVTEDAE